jgi:hypothetical protein
LHNPDCDDDLIDALCGLGRKSRGDVADVAPFFVRLAADTDPDVRDAAT